MPPYIQACERCNGKKIRCHYADPGQPCQQCAALQLDCRPKLRKKRKTVGSMEGTSVASIPSVRSPDKQSMQHGLVVEHQHTASSYNIDPPGTSSSSLRCVHAERQEDPGTGSSTYIGRAHYEGEELVDENSARSYTASRQAGHSRAERQTLDVWGAFELPPRPVHQSLMEAFLEYCHPWMPTLTEREKEQCQTQDAPLLLLQSIFLAASRIMPSSTLLNFAHPADFYHRARALYWVAFEKDPLIVIKAITMLHWYNPDGPAYVSYDTSEYWLKIGVGLAFQIGLHKEPSHSSEQRSIRRRVWWSLVARDALISLSRGRPRAIHLDESDVNPLTTEDFPESPLTGELFIAYVDVCRVLGNLVELRSKRKLSPTKRVAIENSLFRWAHSLPQHLHISLRWSDTDGNDLRPHDFKTRQLHAVYFTCVAVLARPEMPSKDISPAAVLAASFIGGIYEDFLARDLIRFLSPTFTSFAFVAALVILSLRPYPALWVAAQSDLQVLQASLQELSKRWRSAIGASKAVQKAVETLNGVVDITGGNLRKLMTQEQSLFEGYSLKLCRLHEPYERETDDRIRQAEMGSAGPATHDPLDDYQSFAPVPMPLGFDPYAEDWMSIAPFLDGLDSNFYN